MLENRRTGDKTHLNGRCTIQDSRIPGRDHPPRKEKAGGERCVKTKRVCKNLENPGVRQQDKRKKSRQVGTQTREVREVCRQRSRGCSAGGREGLGGGAAGTRQSRQ